VYAITTSGGNVRRAPERLHNPHGVSITPDGTLAYVTNANDDTVSVIATASQTVTNSIPLGSGTTTDPSGTTKGTMFPQPNHQPTAIAVSPNGKNVWVGCNTSSSLVVISTASKSVIDSTDIGLGFDPTGIAFA